MKKDIRLAICLIGILLLGILCVYVLLVDKEKEAEKNNSGSGEVTTGIVEEKENNDVTYNIDGEKMTLHKISYYTIRLSDLTITNTETILPVGIEINPKLICEYVLYSLEDEGIETDINDTRIAGELCIVDMDKSIYDIAGKNAKLEKLILDVISTSIIDNCEKVKSVTFTAEGKDYSSANINLKSGRVYLSES